MMAPTPAAAYGALHWKLRRTIGMAMHRANADLILHRIPRIGSRAASAGRIIGTPPSCSCRWSVGGSRGTRASAAIAIGRGTRGCVVLLDGPV